MDWSNLSRDVLFSLALELDHDSILAVQLVCKSWHISFDQNLWREIFHRRFPCLSAATVTNSNYRESVLKRLRVLRNMREKKSEIDYEFDSHELLNITTGERQVLDAVKDEHALITINYFVTASASKEGEARVTFLDRKSGEKFVILIDRPSHEGYYIIQMTQNSNDEFDHLICVEFDNDHYVINAKERSWRAFKGKSSLRSQVQLNGKHLAIMDDKDHFTIYDTETSGEIYSEDGNKHFWAIYEDKVLFGVEDFKWIIKDFKGNVLFENNKFKTELRHDIGKQCWIHEGLIVIVAVGEVLYFFDMNNGDYFCSVNIAPYELPRYLRPISAGKFVIGTHGATFLLDFESRYLDKSIKVSVVLPQGYTRSLPSVPDRVPFCKLFELVADVREWTDEIFGYQSVCVKQNKEKRVSMIYKAWHNLGTRYKKNSLATGLISEKSIRPCHDVNMYAVQFDGAEQKYHRASISGLVRQVQDSVVLYKEIFKNGEWVPVDYDETNGDNDILDFF